MLSFLGKPYACETTSMPLCLCNCLSSLQFLSSPTPSLVPLLCAPAGLSAPSAMVDTRHGHSWTSRSPLLDLHAAISHSGVKDGSAPPSSNSLLPLCCVMFYPLDFWGGSTQIPNKIIHGGLLLMNAWP